MINPHVNITGPCLDLVVPRRLWQVSYLIRALRP
jgi:hypothetical protein